MKLFILSIIALNLSLISAQLALPVRGSRRLVAAGGPAIRVAGGAIRAQGIALGHGHGGYALGHQGIALAQPVGLQVAQPIGLGLANYGGIGLVHGGGIGLAHGGLGLGLGALAVRGGHQTQHVGPVSAAIETRRTVQVIDVPTSQDVIQPQTLIIEPNVLPVNIEFRSQSSPVNVNQVHIPGRPGEHQATQSEEEPDRLTHEVIKPVIQEVRETIVPFRRITQEILPVQEEINSLVARGQRQQVIAQPQIIAQPQLVAQQVLARPVQRVAVAQPALAVGGLGLVAQPALAQGGLITTGIHRIGAGLIGGGVINGGQLVSGGRLVSGGGLLSGGGLIANGGLIGNGGIITNGGLVGVDGLIRRS